MGKPTKAQQKSRMKFQHKSLRFAVAVIYLLIISLLTTERLVTLHLIDGFDLNDWAMLGGGCLALLVLELLESRLYPRTINPLIRLLFLGIRLICVIAIYQVDSNLYSFPIVALLLFATYFYFGLFPVLVTLGIGAVTLLPMMNVQGISWVEQSAYMGFMLLFAIQIRQDDRIRQRNLELIQELENYAANSTSLAKQDERNRISRDLHDTLGHYLVAVNIQLQKAVAYREIDASESDQAVQQAQQATAEAIKELRQTLGNLREIDAGVDYQEEIQKLVDGVIQNGLPVEVIYRGNPDGYSDLVLVTLFQAVQEGLTNIEKHAQASQAHLLIDFGRNRVNYELKDDGIGFSPDKVDEMRSFGLNGLRERVDLVGGSMKIESKNKKGTSLKLTIPRKLYR